MSATYKQTYVHDISNESVKEKRSGSILSEKSLDGKLRVRIGGKMHRSLTKKSSVDKMATIKKKETCCRRSWFDLWDIISFICVKLIPCFRTLPIFVSCRKDTNGKHQHMNDIIDKAHVGLPVTYDEFTNLMNTFLLMSALFLSFVAGSTTVLGSEQLLEADLIACQRGWAPEQICKNLDAAGYFGDVNATWLLDSVDSLDYSNITSHRLLKQVQGATDDTGSNNDYTTYDSVDISGMWLGTLWDSPHLTSGQELPSFAIMYYSAWSFGLLIMVVVSGFMHYFLLIVSGARQDESIMKTFWDAGFALIVFDLVGIFLALIFWIQSMSRIVGALWPNYNLHGIEFVVTTHVDTNANYAVMFSAFSNEGVIAWSLIIFCIIIIYTAVRTFEAELNYLTSDRPKHVAGFVMKALAHLDDDDCLTTDKAHTNAEEGFLWTSAVYRVIDIFKAQGYKVGGEEDATMEEKDIAVDEMEHFIEEFAHLEWERLSIDKNGKEILSVREKACLLRLHAELYNTEN